MIEDIAVIKLAANHLDLRLVKDYTASTHTIRGIKIQIDFRTKEWEELAKTVVFKSKYVTEPILVQIRSAEDFALVPWEILDIPDGGDLHYEVGVFGVGPDGVQIPTNDITLKMKPGCYCAGTDPKEPTKTIYEQIIEIQRETVASAEEAKDIAQSVRDDADDGLFNGKQGVPGKSPKIGDNGDWFVWNTEAEQWEDTGVFSCGDAPYIGANKHWYVGNVDTGVCAEGIQGEKGDPFTYDDFTPEQLDALKGKNYILTDADKDQIVNDVLSALPTWEGGSY